MKRYLCAALAAALLAPGSLVATARAQDDASATADHEHGDAAHPRDGAMSAGMKEKLGLSDDQAAKLQAAMKTHSGDMKAAGQQMRDALKKLGEQIKDHAKDEDVQAALDALKAARKAMAEQNEKFEDSLATFLTPTQRGKMALAAARMMMRGRRDGRGGGMRERGGDRDGGGDHDNGGDHGDHDGGGDQ